MNPWYYTDFTPDRPDFLGTPAIGTASFLGDHLPDQFFCDIFKYLAYLFYLLFAIFLFSKLFCKIFYGLIFNCIYFSISAYLFKGSDGFIQLIGCIGPYLCLQFRIELRSFKNNLLLTCLCYNLFLEGNQLFNLFMGKFYGFNHGFFRNLMGTCFNHQNCIPGTGHIEIQQAFFPVFFTRVKNKFSIYQAYFNASYGAVKGYVREHQGCRSTIHAQYIRLTITINGKNCTDYLYLVPETIRK